MHATAVLSAAEQPAAIPAAPPVILRCLEILHDPEAGIDSLAACLRVDPGLVTDLLRLVNTPVFGGVSRVTTVERAVMTLGFRRVGDLVVTQKLMQAANAAAMHPLDMDHFWRRALTTALVARRLSRGIRYDAGDDAFLAGLIADIGIPVLYRAHVEAYHPAAAGYAQLPTAQWLKTEAECGAGEHAIAGAAVLEAWQVPDHLVGAVRWHHTPLHSIPLNVPGRFVAGMVGIGTEVAAAAWSRAAPADVAMACVQAIRGADLDPASVVPELERLDAEAEDVGAALRIPFATGGRFGDVSAAMRTLLAGPGAGAHR